MIFTNSKRDTLTLNIFVLRRCLCRTYKYRCIYTHVELYSHKDNVRGRDSTTWTNFIYPRTLLQTSFYVVFVWQNIVMTLPRRQQYKSIGKIYDFKKRCLTSRRVPNKSWPSQASTKKPNLVQTVKLVTSHVGLRDDENYFLYWLKFTFLGNVLYSFWIHSVSLS